MGCLEMVFINQILFCASSPEKRLKKKQNYSEKKTGPTPPLPHSCTSAVANQHLLIGSNSCNQIIVEILINCHC